MTFKLAKRTRMTWIPAVMFALTLGTVVLVLSVSLGGSIAAVQVGIATGHAAMLASRQIHVNPETFTFPALQSEDQKYVLEMNTGANFPTDAEREPVPQMVDSYKSRAQIALENYQAAHALNGEINVTRKIIDAGEVGSHDRK